jgi:hypothetical protein
MAQNLHSLTFSCGDPLYAHEYEGSLREVLVEFIRSPEDDAAPAPWTSPIVAYRQCSSRSRCTTEDSWEDFPRTLPSASIDFDNSLESFGQVLICKVAGILHIVSC